MHRDLPADIFFDTERKANRLSLHRCKQQNMNPDYKQILYANNNFINILESYLDINFDINFEIPWQKI